MKNPSKNHRISSIKPINPHNHGILQQPTMKSYEFYTRNHAPIGKPRQWSQKIKGASQNGLLKFGHGAIFARSVCYSSISTELLVWKTVSPRETLLSPLTRFPRFFSTSEGTDQYTSKVGDFLFWLNFLIFGWSIQNYNSYEEINQLSKIASLGKSIFHVQILNLYYWAVESISLSHDKKSLQ